MVATETRPMSIHAGRVAGCLPALTGLGLKPEHFQEILQTSPDLGFWEIHAENYMVEGGPFHHYLTRIRERYPLSIHGVGLSIGSEAAPDPAHLERLKKLLDRYQPALFSEHLAWVAHDGISFNDLLPLPYDEATLARVCRHIGRVQEDLGRQILIENPATYLGFESSSMAEPQFVSEVVALAGCGLLLDVNNVYVSATNHGLDPYAYLDALPLYAAGEIHLAGCSEDRDASGAHLLIDSHDVPVDDAVWSLYAFAIERTGNIATLIERDAKLPPLAALLEEVAVADRLLAENALAGQARRRRA